MIDVYQKTLCKFKLSRPSTVQYGKYLHNSRLKFNNSAHKPEVGQCTVIGFSLT